MPAVSNDTPDFQNTQQKSTEYEMMMSIFEMSLVGVSLRLSMYGFNGFPHKHGKIHQTLHDSKGPYDKGRHACA